jgi:prephenate dehydrogenase
MQNKKKSIGIFGFGRFGQLMAVILKKNLPNLEINVYKYKDDPEFIQNSKKIGVNLTSFNKTIQSEVIVLGVPISKTQALIKKIAPKIKGPKLILDICSVKGLPSKWMKRYLPKQVEILGTHPMFGPGVTQFDLKKLKYKLKNFQIVLCPIRIQKKKLIKLKTFLRLIGLEVIETTPREHDKQVAKSISLVHFLSRSLDQMKIKNQKITTYGYSNLIENYYVTNCDWQLFFDVINYNRYAKETIEKFLNSTQVIQAKIIKHNYPQKLDFCRKMIDKLDFKMMRLLEKRYKFVDKIGQYKKDNNLPIVDKKREDKIINEKIKKTDLNPKFIQKLYKLIIEESYRREDI